MTTPTLTCTGTTVPIAVNGHARWLDEAPAISVFDPIDMRSRYAKLLGKDTRAQRGASDCAHIVPGELRSSAVFALGRVSLCAPFSNHVARVVRSGSKKQVRWVDARAVVACVEDIQAVRHAPVGYGPRHSMTPKCDSDRNHESEVPIAPVHQRAHPIPARFGLLDFGPESRDDLLVLRCKCDSIAVQHRSTLSRSALSGIGRHSNASRSRSFTTKEAA